MNVSSGHGRIVSSPGVAATGPAALASNSVAGAWLTRASPAALVSRSPALVAPSPGPRRGSLPAAGFTPAPATSSRPARTRCALTYAGAGTCKAPLPGAAWSVERTGDGGHNGAEGARTLDLLHAMQALGSKGFTSAVNPGKRSGGAPCSTPQVCGAPPLSITSSRECRALAREQHLVDELRHERGPVDRVRHQLSTGSGALARHG